MSKKEVWSNYRVVIEPRAKGDLGMVRTTMFGAWSAEEERRICEDIADKVRAAGRAGLIDDVGHVQVDHDSDDVCEHCGSRWTEDGEDYNGGCCAADQAPQDARDAEAASEQAS